MISVYNFEDVQDLAKAVAESAELMDRKLTARPYNPYDPKRTSWFLIPSTDWPAYPYGKGMLKVNARTWSDAKALSCFHLEKGFGPKAAQLDPSLQRNSKVLGDHWLWRSFLRDLSEGHIQATAQEIARSTGEPVQFEMAAIPVNNPGRFDPYNPTHNAGSIEWVRFQVTDGEEHLIDDSQARDFLYPVSLVRSLAEIPPCYDRWIWTGFGSTST